MHQTFLPLPPAAHNQSNNLDDKEMGAKLPKYLHNQHHETAIYALLLALCHLVQLRHFTSGSLFITEWLQRDGYVLVVLFVNRLVEARNKTTAGDHG